MKSSLSKIAFTGLFVFALPVMADSKSAPSNEVQLSATENMLQEAPPAPPAKDPHAGHKHAETPPASPAKDPHAGHNHAETPPGSPAKDPHAGHNHAAEKPAVILDAGGPIAQEQSKLEAAIKTGELAKVQPLAFGIRDLAIDSAAKTTGPKAAESKKVVDGIKASAAKLGEYGKKGDAKGVTMEYATFKKELQSLAAITPQQTPSAVPVTDPHAGHDHGEKKPEKP